MFNSSSLLHARLLDAAPSKNFVIVEPIPFWEGNQGVSCAQGSALEVRLANGFEGNAELLALAASNADKLQRQQPITLNMFGFLQHGTEIELGRQHGSLLVIEPNWLVNVTALTELDYCQHRFHVRRFLSQAPSEQMLRGSLVHDVFEAVLKTPEAHDVLRKRLQKGLTDVVTSFALMDVCPLKAEETVRGHLNRLYRFRKRHLKAASNIQSERYMISPYLGLKGKIDAVLEYEDGSLRALELKTGKCWGGKVQKGHAFQAQAYTLMLSLRYLDRTVLNPVVVYSGDEGLQEGVVKQVSCGYDEVFHVMQLRNSLVIADLCSTLVKSLSDGRCASCRQRHDCLMLSELLKPAPEDGKLNEHADFFNRFYRQLLQEYDAIRIEQIKNLKTPVVERIEQGRAIKCQGYRVEDGFVELKLETLNKSEIREGDACLLSCAKGAIFGDCAEAVVDRVDAHHIRVKTPAASPDVSFDNWGFKPTFLELHVKEAIFEKNFASLANLFKKQSLSVYIELLKGKTDSLEANLDGSWETADKIPAMQQRAVSLAIGLQKLLLIQGPPGTGKTTTIARIVKALTSSGKRCLIACYTHRAVEEACKKLARICPEIGVYRLNCDNFAAEQGNILTEQDGEKRFAVALLPHIQRIKQGLASMEVFVGTTHAWLSGNYDNVLSGELFDVALIDEASQIFAPHIFGILGLSKAHILVGDHKQLPPVTISDAVPDLKKSLFETLFELEYGDKKIKVMLDEQFRMPDAVCDFVSQAFYDGKLHTSPLKSKQKAAHPVIHSFDKAGDVLSAEDAHILLISHDKGSENELFLRTNPQEATLIAQLVHGLLEQCDFSKNTDEERLCKLIGIIAPYRAQVAAIRTELARTTWLSDGAIKNMVDTVERFQGDEREFIFFSLTGADWQANKIDGVNKVAPNRFLDDPRRLNVAISRARRQFIGVGNWKLAASWSVLIGQLVEFVQRDPRCLLTDVVW